ncbi:hypothetical protein [Dyadobacter luticola]|uniref:Uncharacterized protein n=1 Tax=Dyadobacter luticola TaxID=1979387 RepID=A0A5R9L5T5_9BACT|nr:hypothetical protein [Dyadobacter luticola]TLV03771.1 hypothetical protein FEN17_09310 [Dyadobacter luticola]
MKNLKALILLAFLTFTAPVFAQTTPAQTDKDKTAATKLKSDGTPDKRYSENKKLKKDGTPDKRYSENKNLKKDGTPDKRYKSNKADTTAAKPKK